jgi:hypothetical protein
MMTIAVVALLDCPKNEGTARTRVGRALTRRRQRVLESRNETHDHCHCWDRLLHITVHQVASSAGMYTQIDSSDVLWCWCVVS